MAAKNFNVIDAHTHFFSKAFFDGLLSQVKSPTDEIGAISKMREKAGIEIPSANVAEHTQRWVDEMKKHQISKMVTFASLPQEALTVAQAVKAARGKLIGYTLINPLAPDPVGSVQTAAELGFKGIILFPVMHRFNISGLDLQPVFEKIQECRLVAMVHFGLLQIKLRDILGLPRPFDLTFGNPLSLQVPANQFQSIPFVIPHFGCGFFRETLMLGSQCENVFVDTSSSNSWINTQPETLTLPDVFKKTKNIFGSERIFFGTDSSVFPRGYRRDILDQQITAMKKAGFSELETENILGKNIATLLNLK